VNPTPSQSPRDRIADLLRAQIVSGELAPGVKLETVRELAEKMKSGQVAIVRGIERLVEEGLLVTYERKGVYVNERKEWRPIPLNVAILTSVTTHVSSTLLESLHLTGLQELQRQLADSGALISMHGCVIYPNGPKERRYIPPRKLALFGVKAICAAGMYDLSYLGQLFELGIPVIAYDVDASGVRMDSVFVDESLAAFRLTNALLKRGHRRVVMLAGSRNSPQRDQYWNYDPSQALRQDGYELALRAAGLEPEILHREWSGDEATEALQALPSGCALLSAITLNNPLFSKKNFEVAGWSMEPLEKHPRPVVARCGNDQRAMGAKTLEILHWRLAHPTAPIQRVKMQPIHEERT
jgi:DNA-binding LacI/PurR family transcriptional regulator/DNA-binding transcriptional regulator YhcF (GntR family)